MDIVIREVRSKADLRKFIFLPEQLHGAETTWVPPFYADEWKFYDPSFNKAMRGCETVLFLAFRQDRLCGRIMGIIHHLYNAEHGEQTARFFNPDCTEDQEVLHALTNAVEQWAGQKGMKRIIGPFGFSEKDPQGLRVEGFEHLPVIATATNPPWLPPMFGREGYSREIDCLVYSIPVPEKIPESYQRIYDLMSRHPEFRPVEFKTKKQLKPYIVPVLRLVNDTYRSLYGFVPMDEEEMHRLAAQYLPLLEPAFTRLVLNSREEPVAFVVASPDFSAGIKRAEGRLFPFGFWHILNARRKSTQLDLFLGAVRDDCRHRGLLALLAVPLIKAARLRGMKTADSHLILETNKPMRAVMERLGGMVYKRYRIYGKNLNG